MFAPVERSNFATERIQSRKSTVEPIKCVEESEIEKNDGMGKVNLR